MKIMSFNANGIRSAARKGFFEWLHSECADVDVVCVQEVRAQQEQLLDELFFPKGYHCFYYDAQKKGYSGTAIYCKQKPKKVHYGLGWDPADSEARYIQVDFDGLSVGSVYMPSGSSSEARQQVKFDFLGAFEVHMDKWRRSRSREFVLCGDWNMCHQEKDLKNWRANQKNSGFLPEEREWLSKMMKRGWVDVFRTVNPNEDQYTWWSNRGQAYAKNVGWRLDYQLVTPKQAEKVLSEQVYKEQKFSDHAPLIIEYKD